MRRGCRIHVCLSTAQTAGASVTLPFLDVIS
jgi:hypothetical protein